MIINSIIHLFNFIAWNKFGGIFINLRNKVKPLKIKNNVSQKRLCFHIMQEMRNYYIKVFFQNFLYAILLIVQTFFLHCDKHQ